MLRRWQDRQLPDAGVADARARRSPGHVGAAVVSSRELDEQSGSVGASGCSGRLSRAVVSGFVSRDNPDPSAKNMGKVLDAAGFARWDVFLWNVVPYCVSTETQNRNATAAHI